ncbi:uncharacterized protein LOC133730244 [Rosa rugosa]|uniref:uncharacterized protein LOC133730244 n=1 Tax=Rosa rugosa TaxID=74645 RepID=UPI002B40BB61|nr:uncharacterized protein LOC133730244 [Rosa rugosa]
MSNHLLGSIPFSISKPPSNENVCQVQESKDKAAPQNAVTYVYQAKLAGLCCNVTATWGKDLKNHFLCIEVPKPCQEALYICKIDLNSCQLWGKKGLKSFDIDGRRVDVYWDFRQAKFSGNPEPCSDYYVALVSKAEVVLLLGDLVTDAYKRTRSKPALEEATLMYKKEVVCGKRLFCSKAMLEVGREEHDIVIEASLSGPNDPEMWITVDGTMTIRIMNLNWRFRGNESVMLNDFPVEILWDVYDWLFSKQATGQGLFIFKPGRLDWESSHSDPGSRNSEYNSPKESSSTIEFCHFLYAWKTE